MYLSLRSLRGRSRLDDFSSRKVVAEPDANIWNTTVWAVMTESLYDGPPRNSRPGFERRAWSQLRLERENFYLFSCQRVREIER
jgi:hypothetical protein